MLCSKDMLRWECTGTRKFVDTLRILESSNHSPKDQLYLVADLCQRGEKSYAHADQNRI